MRGHGPATLFKQTGKKQVSCSGPHLTPGFSFPTACLRRRLLPQNIRGGVGSGLSLFSREEGGEMPVFAVELRVVQTVSAGNMDEAAEIAFDELSMFDPKIGHIEELGPSEESSELQEAAQEAG